MVCENHRCPKGNALGVHTHGYVEDFCESLMRKRSVQIELKIAQFRSNYRARFRRVHTGEKNVP